MSLNDYDSRFAGLRRLYGEKTYSLLQDLHFCVVGVGGVGSWTVEALARSGVGSLTLIDFDEVSPSNINRQIHATDSSLEKKKIHVLADRVHDINPNCNCDAIDDFLTDRNLEAYLSRGYDCVVDAIDSIGFKAAMISYCRRNKIPIVISGGAGGRRDPTKVRVADLSRTRNDALVAKVRRRLKDSHGFSRNPKRSFGVECVFSDEQPVYPKSDGSVCHEKPGIHGVHLDCELGYGATSSVTAVFGFMAAARALEKALARRSRSPMSHS